MSDLETILNSERSHRGRGCPICGERNTAALVVSLRELGETGKFTNGRQVTKSRSLCSTHAAALWTKLTDAMPL